MKKILVVSCSHGNHIDSASAKAVLQFKKEYKPDTIIHLGDFIDLSAFMASNLKDGSGERIDPDLEEGLDFVMKLEPTTIFLGNHEDRLYNLASSNQELVRWAASKVTQDIEYMARKLKAELVPYAGTFDSRSWRRYGNTAFGHGFLYSEHAVRDHVEMVGMPVVHGHIHKIVHQPGRAIGAPMGISVGCLASVPAMAYAKNRRATASWCNGYGWGEYDSTKCVLHTTRIKEWQQNQAIPHGN